MPGNGMTAYTDLAKQTRRDELILSHLGLVRHVIGRLLAQLPPGTDVENLESAGTLGLVEAASKFDPARGVKFATFAQLRIRGAVLDEIRRNHPLPQQVVERIRKVREAYEKLPAPVTVEALGQATGLSIDETTDTLAAMNLTRMVSLNHSDNESESWLADSRVPPDERVEHEEQKQLLADALTQLPDRDRLVVTLYFLEELRLAEIGRSLGLSESRVSRILNAALFEMGQYVRRRESIGRKAS